jgi:hypothetical protein
MPSAAQIIANQANAQHSTGPRTPEGKAASAQNATKHNLAGEFRVLPNESQENYDRLLAKTIAEHNPTTEHEYFCVEVMVQARWKKARINRLEATVVGQMVTLSNSDDADAVMSIAMINKADGAMAKLARYSAQANRDYFKAHSELKKSKGATEGADKPKPQPAANQPVQNEPVSPQTKAANGFHIEPGENLALRL